MLDLLSGLNFQAEEPACTIRILRQKLWMRFEIPVDLDDAAAKGGADGSGRIGKNDRRDAVAHLYGLAHLRKFNPLDLPGTGRIIRRQTHHGARSIH